MSVKKILVAPLNWGLGHATRCIPLIDALVNLGHQVFIGSDGAAGRLLVNEYPKLTYFELPSYEVQYPSSNFYWHWLKKSPHMIKAVQLEHKRLSQLVDIYDFDVIISDNRYGIFHPQIKSILLTHQLSFNLSAPIASLLEQALNRVISRFNECWIPDGPPSENLSGKLSNRVLPIPKHYIGIVSRMKQLNIPLKYKIAIILSGPEPSRTQLQKQLEGFLHHYHDPYVFVLGLPGQNRVTSLAGDNIYPHASSEELNRFLNESEIVISRSGYTSIMDYYTLNKRAVLMPTPMQPEQQYLAERHGHRPEFHNCREDLSDLDQALSQLSLTVPSLPVYPSFTLPEL